MYHKFYEAATRTEGDANGMILLALPFFYVEAENLQSITSLEMEIVPLARL